MASLQALLKLDVTLGVTQNTNSTLPVNPDKYSIEFTVQNRLENRIFALAPGQVMDIDLVAEGYDMTHFVRIQCTTKNKSFKFSFNGATQRAECLPVTTSSEAMLMGTMNVQQIKLENPDTSMPIHLALSVFKRVD